MRRLRLHLQRFLAALGDTAQFQQHGEGGGIKTLQGAGIHHHGFTSRRSVQPRTQLREAGIGLAVGQFQWKT